ncbi:MAG: hypothetical protein IT343_07565 [Candidatus Melainabacteria bacterium]|nr:hypothetical protein [Candidatus Melainabacteria bacterium]
MKRKKDIFFAVVAISVLALFSIWFALFPAHSKFESKRWKAATGSARVKMVNDLTRSYQLVGMSRQQAFDLLGLPDGTRTGDIAAWNMGTTLSSDDNFFYLYFKNDKVERFENFQR